MLLSRFELSSEVTSVRYSRVSLFALTSSCLLSSLAVSWGNKGAPGPPIGIPGGKGGAPPPAVVVVVLAPQPLVLPFLLPQLLPANELGLRPL